MTDMSQIFFNVQTFNDDISSWDTSKVANMSSMFYYAAAFNQDIGSWNTGAVTDMSFMFNNAATFDQDLSGWNVALTLTRPSLTRNNFTDGSPLALPANSHKLPPFV
jgi:surface protein